MPEYAVGFEIYRSLLAEKLCLCLEPCLFRRMECLKLPTWTEGLYRGVLRGLLVYSDCSEVLGGERKECAELCAYLDVEEDTVI